MSFPGIMMLCQLPTTYLAVKNHYVLQLILSIVAMFCAILLLLRAWMRYSRLSEGGPALWVDGNDFVVGVDKTVRIPVTEIQDYKFIVASKTREPLELKLEMQNGKTQRFPLYEVDDIAPLVGFMRRLVPGKA
jgi:hypothetical protein